MFQEYHTHDTADEGRNDVILYTAVIVRSSEHVGRVSHGRSMMLVASCILWRVNSVGMPVDYSAC